MAVESISFEGWSNNLRVSNDTVELIVTLDVGPRIMSYRRAGGQNVFKVFLDEAGGTGESGFKLRGGHRLWRAPEDIGAEHGLTYVIDKDPVDHKMLNEFSVSVAHVAPSPHRPRREMCVHASQSGPKVTIEHTLQPDEGSNFETFTNWDFLELESLGPYRRLEPGASLQHTEIWALFADVNLPDPQDEHAFLAALEGYAQQLF